MAFVELEGSCCEIIALDDVCATLSSEGYLVHKAGERLTLRLGRLVEGMLTRLSEGRLPWNLGLGILIIDSSCNHNE